MEAIKDTKLKEETIEKQERKQENEQENEQENRQESGKENKQKNKKELTIFGISIWRILAYFVIYSIARIHNRNTLWSGYQRCYRKQKKLLIWTILCNIWSRCMYYDSRPTEIQKKP